MIDNWFLGFFEADGCFTYQCNRPSMEIAQAGPGPGRIASILFGGNLNYVVPKSKHGANGYIVPPRWTWQARNKNDLLNAVWFFDQHPLIGPKKEEYEIWRKMVLRYVTHGQRDKKLVELCDHLSATRNSKQKNFAKKGGPHETH